MNCPTCGSECVPVPDSPLIEVPPVSEWAKPAHRQRVECGNKECWECEVPNPVSIFGSMLRTRRSFSVPVEGPQENKQTGGVQ